VCEIVGCYGCMFVFVSFLAQQLGKEFDHIAEAVLPSLFLLIPNSVKIMATSGTTAIRFIVQVTTIHCTVCHLWLQPGLHSSWAASLSVSHLLL